MYNYTPNRLKLKGTQHVNLEVALPEGEYKVSHYRLDENNCNCYTEWKKLGSKEALTQLERNAVLEAQQVKLYYPEETFVGSTYTDSVVMPDDSVSIIKFTRI
jgi:beta-xylosidase